MLRSRCRHPLALAATAVLALCAAGCGGGSRESPHGRSTGTSASSPKSTATSASSPGRVTAQGHRRSRTHGAPVGATQRVHAGGSTLDVTVTGLLDRLNITGAGPVAGVRPTGVQVVIRNLAGATYDSTASGDWSVLTTAGLAQPLFVRHGTCETPLTDFESLIGVGETRTGCVAFSVRQSARILSVRFSPHSRAPGTVAWR